MTAQPPRGPVAGRPGEKPAAAGRPATVGFGATLPRAPEAVLHRFADEAMGAVWGIVIAGVEAEYARGAAQAAFEELHRLECLEAAARIHAETGGAFDVTLGRLQDLWWPKEGRERPPTDAEIAEARRGAGMVHLVLDESEHAVGVTAGPLAVDLGGIGKGYAVDMMVELLREWSVPSALVHGGESTVFGLGAPPGASGWLISTYGPGKPVGTLASARLLNRALSGSGSPPGARHVLDPRTGRPAEGNAAAWVVTDRATDADALSTAFLVMTPEQVERYCARHPGTSGMLLREDGEVWRFGSWLAP